MLDLGLNGKKYIVFGGSSGIGRQIALDLSVEGAFVTLVAKSQSKLEKVLSELNGSGHVIYSYDLTKTEGIGELIDQMVLANGKFDGMVYSAGISAIRPAKACKSDFMKETFSINFFSYVEAVRSLSNRKCHNEPFSIVAISSCASTNGGKGQSVYSASKAAIDASSRVMALELSKQNIRVNTIRPSNIKTPMYESGYDNISEQERSELERRQFLGLGEPSDVSNMALYLLSNKSKFITGSSIAVDGGFTCH